MKGLDSTLDTLFLASRKGYESHIKTHPITFFFGYYFKPYKKPSQP
jgi:hypothetical protein